jgi:RNA polymerase sigma-70 factor (ECF subfamily)
LRCCRTTDGANDLVQDTLLKAFLHRAKFQPGTALKSWLFTIMCNHFCSQFPSEKRQIAVVDDRLQILTVRPAAQEWSLQEHEVVLAIEPMPPTFSAVLLQESACESYEDVARSLGFEIGTVKSRVNRARRQLTQALPDLFDHRDRGSAANRNTNV